MHKIKTVSDISHKPFRNNKLLITFVALRICLKAIITPKPCGTSFFIVFNISLFLFFLRCVLLFENGEEVGCSVKY